ncbi:membrane protein insertase YidC [Nakamurella antarctica]|uniref:Membrane protein insertase YidC n=2 Tax=Nakamurella antarctica TaxID=1902245 RepID=A0A3G9A099_9ACTN|nr:membrane protein insertase YidC [Nakamurella antarctica]
MWLWHKVFGAVLGSNNPWAWVLSVIFLVFTLRAVLFKPFMKQMNSSLRMQELQPQMKKIREKYKDDKQRMSEEIMKLNKEAGVNPIGGCLPALIQAPVFIGLFHVLRTFNPAANGNYFFSKAEVISFVDAKLFNGAPLSSFMTMPNADLLKLGADRPTIVAVGIPLTILAGIATHLTSRRSVARQSEAAAGAPQTAIMNKLMLYVFPLFVILGGPFFPLAILIYWLSNNSWTFGQLYFAHRIQDRQKNELLQVVEEEKQAAAFSKPRPGARPIDPRKPVVRPSKIDGSVSLSKDPHTPSHSDSAGSAGSTSQRPAGSTSQRPAGGNASAGARPQSAGGKKKPRKP